MAAPEAINLPNFPGPTSRPAPLVSSSPRMTLPQHSLTGGCTTSPASATGLPENAGVAGSSVRQADPTTISLLALNMTDLAHPRAIAPYTHHYVFTVYALDITLHAALVAQFSRQRRNSLSGVDQSRERPATFWLRQASSACIRPLHSEIKPSKFSRLPK